jgi:hypothetical protein
MVLLLLWKREIVNVNLLFTTRSKDCTTSARPPS